MSSGSRTRARTDVEISQIIAELTASHQQKELAKLLGVDPSAISRARSGKRSFNLREVSMIADWLGIDPDEILFVQQEALAWRSEGGAGGEEASRTCREAVKDFLAFRTVAG